MSSIRSRPLDWGICMGCHRQAPGVHKTQRRIARDGTAYHVVVEGGNGLCLFCRNGVVAKVELAC